jgi:hypothetical protein
MVPGGELGFSRPERITHSYNRKLLKTQEA